MPADPAQHPEPAQQPVPADQPVPTDEEVPTDEAVPKYGRARLYAGLVGRSWLWFIVGCLAITLIPILFGWRPYVVESGSMEPRINIGDVVLASPVSDRASLLGRVTVFNSPSRRGEILTHRVVRFDGLERMVTKGDANRIEDTGRITMTDVRGLGRLLVRWVGLPLVWIQTKQWLFLLLFIASLWLAGLAVIRDHEEDEDDGTDGSDPPTGDVPAAVESSTRTSVTLAASRRFRLPGATHRALGRASSRLARPGWLLRTGFVLMSALVLLVPATMASFAATTKSTTDAWTVPNFAGAKLPGRRR